MSDNKQNTEDSILLRSVENYFKSEIPICDFQAIIPKDTPKYIHLLVKEPGETQFKACDQLNSMVIKFLILLNTSSISPHSDRFNLCKSDISSPPNINTLYIDQRVFAQKLYISIEDIIKSKGYYFSMDVYTKQRPNPMCYASLGNTELLKASEDPKFREESIKQMDELQRILHEVFEIPMESFDRYTVYGNNMQIVRMMGFTPNLNLKNVPKASPIAPEAPRPTFMTSSSAQNLVNNNSNDDRDDRKARADREDRGDSKAQAESGNSLSQAEIAKPISKPESPKKPSA